MEPLKLNENQFNNLTKYYKYLRCAKYSHNVLLPHYDCIHIMEIVYGEHWQNFVPTSFHNCGRCKLEQLEKICNLYESYGNGLSYERCTRSS